MRESAYAYDIECKVFPPVDLFDHRYTIGQTQGNGNSGYWHVMDNSFIKPQHMHACELYKYNDTDI